MNTGREEGGDGSSGGRFHTVQPLRDPESNWLVDIAKNLEDYLLKICSGDISGEDGSHISVNFAEAALLLQGSVQVYSRKVEYLYSLVLHALEFISQKSEQHDEGEGTSNETEGRHSKANVHEDSETFWFLDDIPVDPKNCLDNTARKDAHLNYLSKPPANLVVLEGDCLDNIGDGGELENYLLATSYIYQDFILLDPCDASAVNDFLEGYKCNKGISGTQRSKNLSAKSRKSFFSPGRRSGGTADKSALGKRQDVNLNQTPIAVPDFELHDQNVGSGPHPCGFSENNFEFDNDDGYSGPDGLFNSEEDEEDDPWKPLNPHEPGNLKVKPFKRVKEFKKREITSTKETCLAKEIPLAKLDGPVSLELTNMWKAHCCNSKRQHNSSSPPLYEKLRQSLVNGGLGTSNIFGNSEIDNDDNGFDDGADDFAQPDPDFPEMPMDEDLPCPNNKHDDTDVHFDLNACQDEGPSEHKSLEDLCRSHLDALLASIAESEKQTELAARVSTWKQKIEQNLEDQDSRPPFDIHEYGGKIMDKLVSTSNSCNAMSFSDIVRGQEKHDVARSFSALLQMVNNGSVDLDKDGAVASTCYAAENPFHVKLLNHARHQEVRLRSSKKRAKSPASKVGIRGTKKLPRERSPTPSSLSGMVPSRPSCKLSVKISKIGRLSPESKRRRRSQLVEPVDLHSTGRLT